VEHAKDSLTTTIIFVTSSAIAQRTVKIGLILAYSGPFSGTAGQMDNGIKLYMLQHGDTVAGKKIELVRKDTGGFAPLEQIPITLQHSLSDESNWHIRRR
jgi:hypothetical protein